MTTMYRHSFDAIDQGVAEGRRLRAQALRDGFSTVFGWLTAIARAMIGRRTAGGLGGGDCGDPMRA